MTERSYPFATSPTNTEDDYSKVMMYAASDGVCGSPSDSMLRPTANGTTNITVPVGEAFVRGQKYINDANLTLAIPANGGSSPRLDYVILRNDPSSDHITAVYKQGGTALPTLTRNFSGVWEIPLAAVTVPAGATTVQPTGCVDARWFTSAPVSPSLPNYRRDPAYGSLIVENGKDVYVGDGSTFSYLGTAGDPKWQTYTPVWSADSTINWGTGAVNVGRYKVIGKTCHLSVILRPRANPGPSTNPLTCTLPALAANNGSYMDQIGTVTMDSNHGDGFFLGALHIFPGSNYIDRIRVIDLATGTNGSVTTMKTNDPVNFQGDSTAQDMLRLSVTYEIA